MKDREQLASLDPYASTLLLSTLHWPDEIRSVADLALPESDVEIKPAERAMAEQLIAAMTGEFDPAAYHDEYREALLQVIEAKAAGAEIAEPVAAPAAQLTDLMAALEASVAAAKASRAERTPEPEQIGASRKGARRAPAAAREQEPEEAPAELAPARRRKSA
jgi:DNA end-binding protein Ku